MVPCLMPDLHFHDGGLLWTADLLHRHHHQEVFHDPGLRPSLWEPNEQHAVVWYPPGIPW